MSKSTASSDIPSVLKCCMTVDMPSFLADPSSGAVHLSGALSEGPGAEVVLLAVLQVGLKVEATKTVLGISELSTIQLICLSVVSGGI